MGSLPNLHELEEAERKREKRREYEFLLEQRARDTSQERERLSLLEKHRQQSSYNAYLMGLGMGEGRAIGMASATVSLPSGTAASGPTATPGVSINAQAGAACLSSSTTGAAATVSGGYAIGGAALLGFSSQTKKFFPHQQHIHSHPHPHQHRHSLTTRHRVLRTRSTGATHNIWDEQMMEHLSAYSPISTRSHHQINPVSAYQVQAALAASRRRESINSSIGATSIRRLITLNNRNCRYKVPAHVRQKVCRNFTCLTVSHGLLYAVLLPLFALQSSNSIWHHREHWLHIGPNIGSLLLCVCCLISAGMCLVTRRLIRRYGYTLIISANCAAVCLFLFGHLYPSIYTLLPAYALLGMSSGPARISKTALIVHFGSKLSCSQHECTLANSSAHTAMDSLHDEHKIFCNRDQKVRRLVRWFQAAQNIGIIFGALIASFVITCTVNDWNCFEITGTAERVIDSRIIPSSVLNTTTAPTDATEISSTQGVATSTATEQPLNLHHLWPYLTGYLDDFYNHNEHGERICGADMCPIWRKRRRQRHDISVVPTTPASEVSMLNVTANSTVTTDATSETPSIYAQFIQSKSRTGGFMLISVYILFSTSAFALSVCIGKLQATYRHERLKDFGDTLLFAGPMAYFIGTEQAYMLADFMRAFVSCSLGIGMISGALVGMGIMQTIVSCTLSMLLRHTKRIIVILAGFFFHSCLLLTLSSWKPSSDDSALFYVIAASWGACNGMWETLILALVTLNHTNHTTDFEAPLQALRYLGLGITFGAHGYLCETSKIIALVIMLVISIPPYALLEIRLESQRKATLINL